MSIRYLVLLILTTNVCLGQEPREPQFQYPINLFADRNLAEKIAQQNPETPLDPVIAAYLAQASTHKQLSEAAGRQLPDVGHDAKRKTIYTGALQIPKFIVLTFSGLKTLEETVASLKKNGLAHNFIIAPTGDIHPVTKANESINDALRHRPYAVGVAGYVVDGHLDERDMNAASITISVVGVDTASCSKQQEQSLIDLVHHLSRKFEITPERVVDYGCIAYPYGRRNTQENLPWELLAQHNLTVWPRAEDNNIKLPVDAEDKTAWTSLALHQIGFMCPSTVNPEDQDFKNCLIQFQKHYKCDNQTGIITPQTICKLNSILKQHKQYNPKLKFRIPPTLEQSTSNK